MFENSNLVDVSTQGWTYTELQNNTTKSINWSDYVFLVIGTGEYANIRESMVVPTTYFNDTTAGTRIILTWNSSIIQIYKNTNTSINISTSTLSSNQTLRIYGLIHK